MNKNYLLSAILMLSGFSVAVLSGCADACEDQYCLNGGDCLDGDCECPTGYYGAHCEESYGSSSGGSSSGGSSSGGSSSGGGSLCSNSCEWANDGVCDDGGPGSSYSVCDCGTDCADCGARSQADCNGGSSSGGSSSGGSSSGSSSGGSSSGGPSYGDVVFWTNSDLGCGYVSVTMSGYSGSISQFYNSSPDCGTSGCANFFGLSAGSYSYSASCGSYSWNGTVTVNANGCSALLLY